MATRTSKPPEASAEASPRRAAGPERVLPLVALRETVIFPEMIVPLQVGRDEVRPGAQQGRRRRLAHRPRDAAPGGPRGHHGPVRAVRGRHPGQDRPGRPAPGRHRPRHRPGPAAPAAARLRVRRAVHLGPGRARPGRPAPRASRSRRSCARSRARSSSTSSRARPVPPEAAVAARNITEPGLLADMVAYSPDMTTEQRQELLETIDVVERLKLVVGFLARQIEILELKGKIQSEVKSEMDKTQREYILREQLKAIQRELGEDDPQQAEINELRDKVEASGMPDEVKARAIKEIDRMSRIPSASPEVGVIRTYVDWLVGLPWNVTTDDQLDIKAAARILDEDHYGLEKIKERILEYLSVRTLADTIRSPILALIGPPGVGKTVAGQERRARHGPQVRAHEPGRHPRRGGDPRPPADLHRGAARSHHPEHQDRGHQQPGVHARRDRQDRHGLPGRPQLGAAGGARPGAEQHLPGQLPGGALRPVQGAVHRHRQPARPDPARAARPDGDHPAAGLHAAGEDRDRQAVPGAQADGEPRPQAEAHRDHRRGDGRAGPGLHQGGRRPEPRARDRQRHAQGRPPGGRGPQAQDGGRRARSCSSSSARRASSTASWRPRTRPAPRPASWSPRSAATSSPSRSPAWRARRTSSSPASWAR